MLVMNCFTQKAFNADPVGLTVKVLVRLAAQADAAIAGWPLVQVTGVLPKFRNAFRIANWFELWPVRPEVGAKIELSVNRGAVFCSRRRKPS